MTDLQSLFPFIGCTDNHHKYKTKRARRDERIESQCRWRNSQRVADKQGHHQCGHAGTSDEDGERNSQLYDSHRRLSCYAVGVRRQLAY